jgi:signal transduction histidine kinase
VGPWRTWLTPTLIGLLQFAWWPGWPLLDGAPPAPVPAGVAGAVALATTVLLGRRRHRPALVALALDVVLTAGDWILPEEALLIAAVAMLVALFHVGAHHTGRTTALVILGLVLFDAAETGVRAGLGADLLAIVLLAPCFYGLAAAFGHHRARRAREHPGPRRFWRRDRSATAEQVAEAWQAGSEAVAAERRRLVRELHDEAAHHLTSIVINAAAAEALGATRPDLRDRALEIAISSSRDTYTALSRLVDTLPFESRPDAAATDLATLVEDFHQLGQPIVADLPATAPPAGTAAAAYGIAREALTNIIRYAPGGTVRLRLSYAEDQAELTVDDDGGDRDTPARTGLGSGRGIRGMRERAEIIGGRLVAGPRPDGGWRVHAILPDSDGTAGDDPAERQARRWQPGRLLVPFAAPLLVAATVASELPRAARIPALLVLLVHASPLLLRRRRPWPAFALVTLSLWLGPLLIATGVTPAGSSGVLACLLVVEVQAVYALGSWGRPPGLTWLGAVVAAASSGALLMVLTRTTLGFAEQDGDYPWWARALVDGLVAAMAAAVLFLPLLLIWLAGYAAWRRKQRRARDDSTIEAVRARSGELARDERYQFAAGLRDIVLKHVVVVRAAAERGDLTAVVPAARQALAAMRILLAGLGRDIGTARENDADTAAKTATRS